MNSDMYRRTSSPTNKHKPRYSISPERDGGRGTVRMFANHLKTAEREGRRPHGREANERPRYQRRSKPSPRRSPSPMYWNKRASPLRGERQFHVRSRSPGRSRSPLREEYDNRNARRSRSRSSNMDIASGDEDSYSMFRNTFREVDDRNPPKITVSISRNAPNDVISREVDQHGYQIRNAPRPRSRHEISRWNDNEVMPDAREILERQGVKNPEEALRRIANIPASSDRFKTPITDDQAIQEQLRLLAEQQRTDQFVKAIPANVEMSSVAYRGISKVNRQSEKPNVTPPSAPVVVNQPIVAPIQPHNYSQNNVSSPNALIAGATQPSPYTMPPPTIANTYPVPNPAATFDPALYGLPPVAQLQQMDPGEMLFRARAELYRRDLSEIRSIPVLMEYIWSQSFDPIPADDPPLLFNEILKNRKDIVGANALYQVICFGRPDLETYYCGMCNHWTTVSEMFPHLTATMHRMNLLHRGYKLFHQKAEAHATEEEKDKFLDFICHKVWSIEGSGQCTNRMRCILNEEAIHQVWPDYKNYIDNSWKVMGGTEDFDATSKPVSNLDEVPIVQAKNSTKSKDLITFKPSVSAVLNRGPVGQLEKVDSRSERPSKSSRDEPTSSRYRDDGRHNRANSQRNKSPTNSRRHRSRSPPEEWDKKLVHHIGNDGIQSALRKVNNSADFDLKETIRRKEQNEAEQEAQRLMRKALGVVVEAQRLDQEQGYVEESMIYAIAEEMGLDKEAVKKSKVIQNAMLKMNVVDKPPQKNITLESFGMTTSDVQNLLSKVTAASTSPGPSSRGGPSSQLPGTWRVRPDKQIPRANIPAPTSQMAARAVSSNESSPSKFDPIKVEREWTDYYTKNPDAINQAMSNQFTQESYDSYYGPGTYVRFCDARKRAAEVAKRRHQHLFYGK